MMRAYILRRLLQAIPTLLGITIISFAIMRFSPGDPVDLLTFNPKMTRAAREALRHQLCLDRPVAEQYIIWMFGNEECDTKGIIRLDFGDSLFEKRPVLDMIVERIPATVELTGLALAVGMLIGVSAGIYSAVKHGSLFDNLTRVWAVIGQAVPAFWLGLILILVFAVQLRWLPVGGRYTLNLESEKDFIDHLRHLVMPVFVLATYWIAVLSRYMRTETLEVIRQDYIRSARAKGVPNQRVYFWHAARNALIPLATILGPAIGGLLAGAVITETIFSWPGMGRMMIEAVFQRDYTLLMANVIIGSVLVVGGNLLSDIFYVIVDPRIRLS
jgi:peptide/nickel transport system permease protein